MGALLQADEPEAEPVWPLLWNKRERIRVWWTKRVQIHH